MPPALLGGYKLIAYHEDSTVSQLEEDATYVITLYNGSKKLMEMKTRETSCSIQETALTHLTIHTYPTQKITLNTSFL